MGIDEWPEGELWWMVEDDPPPVTRASPTSRAAGGGRRDRVWLVTTSVYVEFDGPNRGRRPVTRTLPGFTGRWVLAFSTYGRLHQAHRGEPVEHSLIHGTTLLAMLPDFTGVFLDHGQPDGAIVVLPGIAPLPE